MPNPKFTYVSAEGLYLELSFVTGAYCRSKNGKRMLDGPSKIRLLRNEVAGPMESNSASAGCKI